MTDNPIPSPEELTQEMAPLEGNWPAFSAWLGQHLHALYAMLEANAGADQSRYADLDTRLQAATGNVDLLSTQVAKNSDALKRLMPEPGQPPAIPITLQELTALVAAAACSTGFATGGQ